MRIYEGIHGHAVTEDAWHRHSTRAIKEFLHRHLPVRTRCVDLGSGRMTYREDAVHLDVVIGAVRDIPRGLVGDLVHLPLRTGSAEALWCVGSAINYVPLLEVLGEVRRVLLPGGTFILEYERLHDTGLVSPQTVTYLGSTHVIWTYADEYVEATLRTLGFAILQRDFFHVVSGALQPVLGRGAAGLAWLDPLAGRVAALRKRAANAIVLTRRFAA